MSPLTLESIYNKSKYTIYLDMDGVLCNFDKQFKKLSNIQNRKDPCEKIQTNVFDFLNSQDEKFWSEMEWMPDGKQLWDYVKKLNVCICSTPIDTVSCKKGKKIWVKNNIDKPIKIILTQTKEQYAAPSHILIDDREGNINKWVKVGGIGILHTSTKNSIKLLNKYLANRG